VTAARRRVRESGSVPPRSVPPRSVPPRSVPPRWVPLAEDAAVVAAFSLLAVVCYWHAWTGGIGSTAQANGDVADTIWFLRWVPFAIGHGLNPFFSDYANYPHGVNLLVNTSVPLLGALAAPVTLLAGPVASYNLLATLALAGSAASAYFVVRRWVTWRPAAVACGLVYGFSPYEIGQGEGHLNLMFVVLPPIILLVLHDLCTGRGSPWWRGAGLGLMLVAQFLISTEIFASTLVMGVALVVVLAVAGHRQVRDHVGRVARSLAVAAIVAVALLAYPIWFALAGPGHINGPIQTVALFRADLLGPLVPDSLQRLSPHTLATVGDHFGGNSSENGSYLGITLLGVVLVGAVVFRRRAVVLVGAVWGLVAFVLSLGSRLVVHSTPQATASGSAVGVVPLPEAVLAKLPLLSNALPVRYSLYVVMAAALLLAVVLDALRSSLLRRGWSPVSASAIPALVAIAALVPLVPEVPYGDFEPTTPPTYFTSAYLQRVLPGSVAVTYPYPGAFVVDATLWQAQSDMRFRLPGGYYLVPQGSRQTLAVISPTLGTTPTATAQAFTGLYDGHPPVVTAALRAEVASELRAWQVRTVMAFAEGATPPHQVVAYLTSLLGTRPRHQADGFVWHMGA
jgi:hypothetical protein